MKKFRFLSVTLIVFLGLSFLIKGQSKDPFVYQHKFTQDMGGPFESSNSNSRYALTVAMVDQGSFFLDPRLAAFSSPDVSKNRSQKYISIFTPGISLLSAPFYSLGKQLGFPQLFAYSLNIILAILNFYLIYLIIRKLSFNSPLALVSAGVFIFGTNAYSYAGTLTQHHAVTSALLGLVLLTLSSLNLRNNFLFGLLFGIGLLMDIPFTVYALPLVIYNLWRHIKINNRLPFLKFNPVLLVMLFGLSAPLYFFARYNFQTTGSYSTLAQSIGRNFDFIGSPKDSEPDSINSAPKVKKPGGIFRVYKSRYLIQGLYTLVISNERSIFLYSPSLAIAALGFIIYLQSKSKFMLQAIFASAVIGLISYAMFADPWGGWSYGPRYLIPSAALLCLFIPYAIQKFAKSKIFTSIFVILLTSSVFINVLGGLTTNLVPPKQEAIHLIEPIPYNFTYNWQLIKSGNTHSLPYILWFSKFITPLQFYLIIASSISLFFSIIYFKSRHEIIS